MPLDLVRRCTRLKARLWDEPRGKGATASAWSRCHDGLALLVPATASDLQQLDVIPSETSAAERLFLHRLFASVWIGRGTVVEIGPFLGGTTRAIALGMMANPRLSAESRVLTFDRFGSYYTGPALQTFAQPLADLGLVSDEVWTRLGTGSFFDLFQALHGSSSYSHLIRAVDSGVPDRPHQAGDRWLALDEECRCSALFIDGCKSWFGTKFFFRTVADSLEPGALVVFQDLGWYTCYWLSAFVAVFRERLDLIASCDSTYAFQLCAPIAGEEVGRLFPDAPQEWAAERFREVIGSLIAEADRRRDYRAVTVHSLHLAAALATLGKRLESIEVIDAIARAPFAHPWLEFVRAARVSPTYTPDGQIFLDS